MSSSKGPSLFTYEFLEDVEDLERYRPGGFHPLHIGDILRDGRYRIIHKLGFGGYSTIWLARDEPRCQYVALKVSIAHSSTCLHESQILERLMADRGFDRQSVQGQFIPPLLDRFTITGPNGSHVCLVTTLARMSLRDAKDGSNCRLFQPNIARAIVAQLVKAVAYLHSRGVVHGDIHPANILLCLPGLIDRLTPEDLYREYGAPDLQHIQRCDGQPLGHGVPVYAVTPMWLGKGSEKVSLADSRIIISDFGESYIPTEASRTYSNSPQSYAPIEAHFLQDHTLSYPADIWSLACTIWEVLGQRPLFEPWGATVDDMLADQIDLLGKLPAAWWTHWDARRDYFTDNGELDIMAPKRRHDSVRQDWDECFSFCIQKPRKREGMDSMCAEEKASLLDMMKSMLRFQPGRRASAAEVLRSEWMERWALPDLDLARRAWHEHDGGLKTCMSESAT